MGSIELELHMSMSVCMFGYINCIYSWRSGSVRAAICWRISGPGRDCGEMEVLICGSVFS